MLPFFFSPRSTLFAVTAAAIHGHRFLADCEGVLLSTEVNLRQRPAAVVIALNHGRVAIWCLTQINDSRGSCGYNLLALHDAQFDVGTSAIPLHRIIPSGHLLAANGYGID